MLAACSYFLGRIDTGGPFSTAAIWLADGCARNIGRPMARRRGGFWQLKSPSWQRMQTDLVGGSGGIVTDLDRRVLQAIGRRRHETGKIKLKSRSRNFRVGSGPGELSFCFSFILYKYIFNWFIFSYSFSLLYLIVTLRWKFWKKL